MQKVMFICTGNICRSAMAEALFKKIAQEKGKKIQVYSCGIYADTGDYPTYDAIEIMKEYEVDLKAHHATNIKESPIQEMDLILCATRSHKEAVQRLYPEIRNKVYTMKEYVSEKKNGQDIDISDPWGYGMNVYRSCASEIYEVVLKLVEKI